ncbi:hypothetical protein IWW42_005254, partial [Coemansia sp. RSA 1085]
TNITLTRYMSMVLTRCISKVLIWEMLSKTTLALNILHQNLALKTQKTRKTF